MKNMEMDLIERYLYDVVRRLPEKQKKDIEQELRTLIEDMVAEREEAAEDSEETGLEQEKREQYVHEVLTELGNPAKLAKSYRGENDSLISGEYYDSYCYILKIVLICAGVGILISNIVSAVIHVVETEGFITTVWDDMLNIGSIPMILVQIFGWITLGYALLEKNHIRLNTNECTWTLKELPQIPYKKAVISRGESAVGVVFGILFAIIMLFVPQLLGAWFRVDGQMISVPLFNLSIWSHIGPLLGICIVCGLIDDFVKLTAGRYCYKVMAVTVITDTLSFCLSIFIFKTFPIWNERFVPEISQAAGRTFSSEFDIMTYFNTDVFTNGLILILFLVYLLDIGTTVYYTLRYGEKRTTI